MRRVNFRNFARFVAIAFSTVLLVSQLPPPAAAQTIPFPQNRVVNVSVSFNSQLPLPDLSEETLAASQRDGRLSLYRLAKDECDVMKTVIAETCRLTNLNISTQIQNYNNGQPVMLYVNANANFTISLKDEGAE